MNFDGKNVVIVGGFGGIGFEICKQFMSKNINHLAIFECVEKADAIKALQDINSKISVHFYETDLIDKENIKRSIAAFVSKVKYIDILVNAAGILADRNMERTINVNLIGPINVVLEALPFMDKNQHGRGGLVVNIASTLGLEPCGPAMMYTASKFGLIGFTRSLADPFYYNLTDVAVMAVCPGSTDTPLRDCIDDDNDTFPYSKPLSQYFRTAKSQSPAVCGEHVIKAIENCRNGSFWISDCGNLKEVDFATYWKPTFE